ncbi:MAG: type I pullulanase [Clostridiales bacterium]|nr:type I pullulanase [Clostridiales bacterium]
MKRSRQLRYFEALRLALVAVLIAAIAFVTLPIGALNRNRAASVVKAEVEASAATKASVEITVNLYATAYTVGGFPYNMWIWPAGGDGSRYDFKAETVTIRDKQWKTLTATIEGVPFDSDKPAEDAIGVIYKHGTSSNADWGYQSKDLMIPANKIVNNKIEIFLVAGDETIYYDKEDADLSNKFSTVKFSYLNDIYRVQFTTGSLALSETTVLKIKDSNGGVHGSLDCTVIPEGEEKNPNVGKSNGNIDFEGEFDFGETYMLVDESTDEDTRYKSTAISKVSLYDNDKVFGSKYNYDGKDLGVTFSADKITYKLWAPASKSVTLNIYASGEGGDAEETIEMKRSDKEGEAGVFEAETSKDMSGKYYTYSVLTGSTKSEIVDPYARSAGRNGKRGMILDLDTTDPDGWANHHRPAARGSYSNAIIYEMHIRDMTIHESSNVSKANRGKFLGLTESYSDKITPLDYIKSLGVTEVHILPMFDFATVNENFNVAEYGAANQFNWGYDPLNYNVPEGSYSSDPADGAKRVNELKQMIMALHKADIRVIMDVVYNHVSDAANSNFEKILPGYFFRTNSAGGFTNGSGCGNDTASERYMFHKFIVDSVNYWADEYKLDGFRFDLMGLHDTLTMNDVYDTLAEKNPDIMVYGEGWTMGTMAETSTMKKADMTHASYMPNIAFFNDITRDAIKGGGFDIPITARGFAEGSKRDAAIYVGAVGGTANTAAGYGILEKKAFASSPLQNINYVSCHDNATLWDKINACADNGDFGGNALETKKAMNRLAATAVFTSQGSVFMLAGEELLRSKPTTEENDYDNRPEKWLYDDYYFADNSYKSPDSTNAIDWSLADKNSDMVDYYKALIELRKNTPQFHLSTKAQIDANVTIIDDKMRDGVACYAIKNPTSNEYVVLLFNGTSTKTAINVPQGNYSVYINGKKANGTTPVATFTGDSFTVGAFSAVVMKADNLDVNGWKYSIKEVEDDDNGKLGLALGLGIGIPAAVLIAGGVVFGVMYSKKKGKKGKGADDKASGDGTPDEKPEEAPSEAPAEESAEQTPEEPKSEE